MQSTNYCLSYSLALMIILFIAPFGVFGLWSGDSLLETMSGVEVTKLTTHTAHTQDDDDPFIVLKSLSLSFETMTSCRRFSSLLSWALISASDLPHSESIRSSTVACRRFTAAAAADGDVTRKLSAAAQERGASAASHKLIVSH
jgi:hypothetical protein